MVMADVNGDRTTVLERAASKLKDNRLAPAGFSTTHYTYDTTNQTGPELAVSIRKQQQFVWAEMDRRHSELARVVATLSNAMIEVLNGPLQDLIQEAVGIVGMVLTGQGLTAKPSVDLDGPDAR